MDDLIFVKNSDYSEYETLLLRRDKLRKEAFEYDREFIRLFGDKILEVFKIKLLCIRKKKEIYYCQTLLNHGETLEPEKLEEFIKQELKDYNKQLEAMIKDNNAAKNTHSVSELDLLEIKKIYRKLAKLIHPDINPKTAEKPELLDLWNRIVIAYDCNNLNDIKELEVLVSQVLESLNIGKIEIEIPDIKEKIIEVEAEIQKIRETDPYLYKYLLEDSEAIKEKNKSLDKEYASYKDYEAQLEELLNGIKGEIGGI